MVATVIQFPAKVCAMCGKPATQSLDLADMGQKHLCDDYPYCTDPTILDSADQQFGEET